jgi:hypothetical protein
MSGAPVRRTSKGEAKPADPVAQVADNKEEDGELVSEFLRCFSST